MRYTYVMLASVGLACQCAAETGGQPEVVYAQSATKIEAMRVDGSFVLGETISMAAGASSRGVCTIVAFDQLSGIDQCGFGDLYPQSEEIQSAVEDVVPRPGTEGRAISMFNVAAERPLCDGSRLGESSEAFQIAVLSWEVVDNIADLDGTDGFAAPPAGLVTPMELVDNDGDTFIDGFNGGFILTYADTDTDGDTISDELLSAGFRTFSAFGLDPLGVTLPSGVDANNDGRPDGGIQVMLTRGDGGDGNGPLFGGLYPATNPRFMFGSTAEDDPSNCITRGQGSSNGTLWAEGVGECRGDDGWSHGSASPDVDELYDPLVDIRDLAGVLAPPNPSSIGIAFMIEVEDCVQRDCCDINGDGACTPADFTAWLLALQNGSRVCDVNQDGHCGPNDFPAWINAFNSSTAGNPLTCSY
ncbi:MAG: hypothetical protein Phyf2KO_12160 [Phycisphaerales bacterium]